MNNWILTSERFPEKDGKYLCCMDTGKIVITLFIGGHFRFNNMISDSFYIAWMPLPEPPKIDWEQYRLEQWRDNNA